MLGANSSSALANMAKSGGQKAISSFIDNIDDMLDFSGTKSLQLASENSEYWTWLQREWQLEDTADQRAYAEELYNKYQSPEAVRKQYEDAGYSPYAALGQSADISPVSAQSTTQAASSQASNLTSQAIARMQTGTQRDIAAGQQTLSALMQSAQMNLIGEQTRGLKIQNDQNESNKSAMDTVWSLPITKDDFPQLYGYDEDWFARFKTQLGRDVTLRDMYVAALGKQVVHAANREAGKPHEWRSGTEFEALNGSMNGSNMFNSYYGNDNATEMMRQLFYGDVNNTVDDAALKSLQIEYQTFKRDNKAWEAEVQEQVAKGQMSQTDAEWQIVFKWLEAINSGSESLSNIVGTFVPTKALTNLLGKFGKPTSKTNYKPTAPANGHRSNPKGRD